MLSGEFLESCAYVYRKTPYVFLFFNVYKASKTRNLKRCQGFWKKLQSPGTKAINTKQTTESRGQQGQIPEEPRWGDDSHSGSALSLAPRAFSTAQSLAQGPGEWPQLP